MRYISSVLLSTTARTTLPSRIGKRNRSMLNLSSSSSLSSLSPVLSYPSMLKKNHVILYPSTIQRLFSTKISPRSAAILERKTFWRELYHNGNDVFTLSDPNPNLMNYISKILPNEYLPFQTSSTIYTNEKFPKILVPGCGRDISMYWLAKQGIGVIGIDYIGEPLRIFSNDFGGLTPIEEEKQCTIYQITQYPKIILIHGDILDLDVPNIYGSELDCVWDRGSLTSIANEDRSQYIQQLYKSLRPNGKILLEYLCCNLPLDGALDETTVKNLLTNNGFTYETISRSNVRNLYPDFNPPGLSYLDEIVIIATKQEKK